MNRGILTALAFSALLIGLRAAEEPPKTPTPPAQANTPKPKLKFDQTTFDFGKTSRLEVVKGTFTFQNVGEGVLKLGKPTTSCGCTVAALKSDTLQPGEKGELNFTLNLGKSRAVIQKNITVDSNDPDAPRVTLVVKADYTPLYQVTPISYYLNLHKGDTTNLAPAVVMRTDGQPFTISKIKPSQSWIEAKVEPDQQTSTNHSVRVQISLKPEGTPRYFTELLQLFTEETDQPAVTLSFSGRLTGDLTLSPESIYWPITDPTKVLTTRRIVLRSSLSDKLEVKNVSSSLKDVEVEAVAKEDGKTYEIVAKLAHVPDKTTNGMIRFDTNIPSQPKVEVPVWVNIVKR
ncbi:MAG: DUF1573 domain-containing protein [Verrucomicrobiota bacterium]